jgi:cytochrome c
MNIKLDLALPFALILVLTLQTINLRAESGKDVFESLDCNMCHKPDTGTIFPSLNKIAAAYDGKTDKLMNYLHGETEPIVQKEQSGTMKPYIEKAKALSQEDMKSLADYILSFKDQ